MENQSVLRQSNGDYKVVSSGGSRFYHVEMFGPHAVSCNCPRFLLGHTTCKHMTTAEQAEQEYQAQQGVSSQPEQPFLNVPLNGNSGFSLLKK